MSESIFECSADAIDNLKDWSMNKSILEMSQSFESFCGTEKLIPESGESGLPCGALPSKPSDRTFPTKPNQRKSTIPNINVQSNDKQNT